MSSVLLGIAIVTGVWGLLGTLLGLFCSFADAPAMIFRGLVLIALAGLLLK